MATPIIVADPATVELIAMPINPDWILEGKPEARAAFLANSADGTSKIMAWSCTAGRFNWRYSVDETVHIISGDVFITNDKGVTIHLGPGDMAFFPAGSTSMWRVPNEVRKLAVLRHAMPRWFGHALRVWNKAKDFVSVVLGPPLPTHDMPEPAIKVSQLQKRLA